MSSEPGGPSKPDPYVHRPKTTAPWLRRGSALPLLRSCQRPLRFLQVNLATYRCTVGLVEAHTADRGATSGNGPSWKELLGLGLVFLALASVAYLPAWIDGASHTLSSYGKDPGLGVWTIGLASWSLAHGANPMYTHSLGFPYGVNLMTNPAFQFVGWLVSPVTLLFGPVAGFNVLMTLGIATSALGAYYLLRQFVRPWPASIGAVMYGFSPFVVAHGLAQPGWVVIGIPPLIFAVTYRVAVDPRRRPVPNGLVLGVLVAAQLLTSSEVLAQMFIVGGLGAVAWLAIDYRRDPARWLERLRRLARTAAVATGVAAILAAYPIWMFIAGPGHVSGPAQPGLDRFSGDLLGPLLPTPLQVVGPASVERSVNTYVPFLVENGAYLGIGLVALMVYGVVRNRRSRLVLVSASLAVVCFVLELGPRLRILGQSTGIPMPFAIFEHLPLVQSLVPIRFSLWTALFAGVIAGVTLQRLGDELRPRGRIRVGLSCTAVILAALVFWVPRWPYHMRQITVPAAVARARVIPERAVVLMYPVPRVVTDDAMIWQAETKFRFSLVGGYFIGPGPNGRSSFGVGYDEAQRCLLQDQTGTAVAATPTVIAAVRADLRSAGVTTIVVVPVGRHPGAAITLLSAALGDRADNVGGDAVFDDVQHDLARGR